MPIRDPARYGPDWPNVRQAILERAGHRCEGSPAYPDCRAANHQPHPVTGSRVVLTIAHLNHRPEDNRPENLRAWCQRCHLTYDAPIHARNRRINQLEEKLANAESRLQDSERQLRAEKLITAGLTEDIETRGRRIRDLRRALAHQATRERALEQVIRDLAVSLQVDTEAAMAEVRRVVQLQAFEDGAEWQTGSSTDQPVSTQSLTVRDVARLAGISIQTVRREIRRGNLPTTTKMGTPTRIPSEIVEAWLDKRAGHKV